jgi:hypothetical protein
MVQSAVMRRSRQTGAVLANRRQAGHPMVASSVLFPALENLPLHEKERGVERQFHDPEDLGPARGIAIGVVLVLPLWGAIGGVAWAAVRIATTMLGSGVASGLTPTLLAGVN